MSSPCPPSRGSLMANSTNTRSASCAVGFFCVHMRHCCACDCGPGKVTGCHGTSEQRLAHSPFIKVLPGHPPAPAGASASSPPSPHPRPSPATQLPNYLLHDRIDARREEARRAAAKGAVAEGVVAAPRNVADPIEKVGGEGGAVDSALPRSHAAAHRAHAHALPCADTHTGVSGGCCTCSTRTGLVLFLMAGARHSSTSHNSMIPRKGGASCSSRVNFWQHTNLTAACAQIVACARARPHCRCRAALPAAAAPSHTLPAVAGFPPCTAPAQEVGGWQGREAVA